MEISKKLILVGAGGAASEVIWVVHRINQASGRILWDFLGYTDDNPSRKGELLDGFPVVGTAAQAMAHWHGQAIYFLCAIGNNRQRQRLAEAWEEAGFVGATLIDPSVIMADTSTIGHGTYVGPLSIVAPHATVGRHVLINTHVGVGHHAVVSDYAQLCPGARVSGGCKIDKGAFLGSNAVVHPGQTIGEGASIGANSFVIRSVKPRFSMLGVPARIVSRPAENGPNAQS
jgi:sugar O-acyltransferase (sialic acid O-acetyltransferase NeuD family)